MLVNYLKLALRLLMRNPFFTFINVIGLSLGFSSFFALWQYATSELKAYHQPSKPNDRDAKHEVTAISDNKSTVACF